MSSLKSRARKLAFGDSNENLSDASSACSSIRSRSSAGKTHGIFRHTSSMSEVCSCHTTEKGTYVAPIRTNKVQRIGRHQTFERFVEALEADGCVIIEDFVSPQISQRVSTAENVTLEPHDDEQIPQQAAIDVNALIRESLLSDSLYQTLSRHFLSLETVSWQHKRAEMRTLRPTVSSSSTADLTHQYLSVVDQSADFHRADSIYHNRHTAISKYEYKSRRDVSLGLYVPELDSLSASVPVKVVPGSHLWDDQKPDLANGVKDIHLHGGDALILLGSLYHQTSPSKIEKPAVTRADSRTPKEKLMHQIWMCSGIYRPADDIHNDDEAGRGSSEDKVEVDGVRIDLSTCLA